MLLLFEMYFITLSINYYFKLSSFLLHSLKLFTFSTFFFFFLFFCEQVIIFKISSLLTFIIFKF